MRLACPNCDAQYEVDDAVIPSEGRDVQCSNCGHTWFFQPIVEHPEDEDTVAPEPVEPATTPPAEAAEEASAPDTASTPDEDQEKPETPAAAAEVDAPDKTEASAPAEQGDETEDPEGDPAPEALPQRKALDDAVASVLREEAQRETEARQADREGGVLESQPDLGLDSGDSTEALRERIARLRGVSPDEPGDIDPDAPRRDLLPDIDEINSTLRATSHRKGEAAEIEDAELAEEEQPDRVDRSRFGTGFGTIILIAAIIFGVYKIAPALAEAWPPAAPYLAAFVEMVDKTLILVNGWVNSGTQWLADLINGLSSEG